MRTILHVDMNNFYASVECLYRPEIRHLPVAVAGDPMNRHGIILAKNMIAKKLGVKTGEAIWEAKLKAPNLVTVPPDFRKYLKFSRLARQILYDYTDQIESFGIDENWIDVTGSKLLCGDGSVIANSIRSRIKEELGITASIGVSFNKIFAKLGSDMKNPVAVTEKIGEARNDHFDFWTPKELNKFLNSFNDKEAIAKAQIKRHCSDEVLIMAFTILFYTGIREGELLALTSNDINLQKRTININKTYKRLKGLDTVSSPKTKTSNRVIKISTTLTEKLKAFLTSIPKLQPTDRIFESINVMNLYRAIHSQAKVAGVKEIRVHDLRHSCCSLLFNLGCTPLQVKTYMGHKNIQITLNIYAHLYPESMEEISRKLQSVEERYQNGIKN